MGDEAQGPATSRFDLIRKLGTGGMGVVYEAYDRDRDVRVALKTLRSPEPRWLYRFKREFRAIADLRHPSIASLYELIADDNQWFFTMELIDGVDLVSYVRTAPPASRAIVALGSNGGDLAAEQAGAGNPGADLTQETAHLPARASTPKPAASSPADRGHREHGADRRARAPRPGFADSVDPARLEDAFLQLARALTVLHSHQVIHRDLKPSNILVTREGRVVLLDFGIVAELGRRGSGDSDMLLGTPGFMAPEQASTGAISPAADWYAFGCVLYCALAGTPPFSGSAATVIAAKQAGPPPAVSELVADVPERLASLCARLLVPDPDRRLTGAGVIELLSGGARTESVAAYDDHTLFIGRTRELGRLTEAFEHSARATHVALLHAPSGMGKTAITERFLRGLAHDAVALRGRCHDRETVPYNGLDGAVDALSEFLHGVPDRSVSRWLPPSIRSLIRLFPVLSWLARLAPEAEPAAEPADAQTQRDHAFAALRSLLAAIGSQHRLVLVIDDLQWADQDTLDLLSVLLADHDDGLRLLLVGAVRGGPDVAEATCTRVAASPLATDRVSLIEVAPLSEQEQAALVERMLGTSAYGDDRVLWSECGGVPLLLAELSRFARATPRGAAQGSVSFEDALLGRIEQLEPIARHLIEIVMAAREPMPASVLANAAGLSGEEREEALEILRREHLLRLVHRGGDPWVDIYHSRIRETSLRALTAGELSRLERALAAAVRDWPQAPPDLVARQLTAVGERGAAAGLYEQAARDAYDKLAFDRAAELYQRALELVSPASADAPRLLRGLGDAWVGARKSFDAAEAYRRAVPMVSQREGSTLIRLAAQQYLRCGRHTEGIKSLTESLAGFGLPLARSQKHALAMFLRRRLSLLLRGYRWRPRTAAQDEQAFLEEERIELLYVVATSFGMVDNVRGALYQTMHVRRALAYGEERRVCRALSIEIIFRSSEGNASSRKIVWLSERVDELLAKHPEPWLYGNAKLGQAARAFFSGQFAKAAHEFRAAEDYFRTCSIDVGWERATAAFMRLAADIYAGTLEGLPARVSELLEEARQHKDFHLANALSESRVWVSLLKDQPELCEPILRDCTAGYPAGIYSIAHYRRDISAMTALLYQSDYPAVLDVAARCTDGLKRAVIYRVPHLRGHASAFRALAASGLGDRDELIRSGRALQSTRLPHFLALSCYVRGALAALAGRGERAIRHLRTALEHLQAASYAVFERPIRYRLGTILGGTEGDDLTRTAVAELARDGAENPERLLSSFAPPLPGLDARRLTDGPRPRARNRRPATSEGR